MGRSRTVRRAPALPSIVPWAALLLWALVTPTSAEGQARPRFQPGGAGEVRSATPPAAATAEASAKPDPARIRQILLDAKRGKVKVYAHFVDLDTGAELIDVSADQKAYPASVAKLFPTAAATRALPPDETLVTRVLQSNRKQERVGRLAIVGAGDPSLTTRDLGALADAVAAAGVRQVDVLVIDHTLFDDKLPQGFAEKATDANSRAPIDALMVDGGAVAFAVRPGAAPGAPVVVQVTPPSPAVQVVNQATTVKGNAFQLSMLTRPAGRVTEVVVQGSLGHKRGVVGAGRKRVADAGFFAGELFRLQLQNRGVQVATTRYEAAGAGMEALTQHASERLETLIARCNKTSNNQYAEALFKLVGARRRAPPATAATALAATVEVLGAVGVDFSKLDLGTGSGLYHANRFPPRQVTQLLRGMAATPEGARFRASLAIGGVDGTLRGRLGGAATRGKVFAKTGTLDDVSGLAGYALGPSGRWAFAMFFNDIGGSAGVYRAVADRALVALLDPSATPGVSRTPQAPKQVTARKKRRRSHRR